MSTLRAGAAAPLLSSCLLAFPLLLGLSACELATHCSRWRRLRRRVGLSRLLLQSVLLALWDRVSNYESSLFCFALISLFLDLLSAFLQAEGDAHHEYASHCAGLILRPMRARGSWLENKICFERCGKCSEFTALLSSSGTPGELLVLNRKAGLQQSLLSLVE